MKPFEALNAINVQEHIEKKSGLSYLAWAWAWGELKKRYPDSFYTIYENASGYFYHTDGKTCWVKTGVTVVDGDYRLEHIEYLPVMDFRNKSITTESVTSFDVNKAIQRSLTKAVARHGLGLYIYAGEDLPEGSEPSDEEANEATAKSIEDKKEAAKSVSKRTMIEAYCREHKLTMQEFQAAYLSHTDKPLSDIGFMEFQTLLLEMAKQ